MPTTDQKEMVGQVLMAVRDYNISTILFRNTIVERLGVNMADWDCLGLLLQKGVSTPTELSQRTGLTSGATTAMLDRLEKSGVIERRRNPEDRRGTLIVLVEAKAAELTGLLGSAVRAQNEFLSNYTEKELEFLGDFVSKLAKVIDEERREMQKDMRKD